MVWKINKKLLGQLVADCNDTTHSTIKMTLKDVTANTCTEYTSKVIKWTTVFWLYRHMKTKKKNKKKTLFSIPKA